MTVSDQDETPTLTSVASEMWTTLDHWFREDGYTSDLTAIITAADALAGWDVGTYDKPTPDRFVLMLAQVDRTVGLEEPYSFNLFYGNLRRLGMMAAQADLDSNHISEPLSAELVRAAQSFYNPSSTWSERVAITATYTCLRWAQRNRRLTNSGWRHPLPYSR